MEPTLQPIQDPTPTPAPAPEQAPAPTPAPPERRVAGSVDDLLEQVVVRGASDLHVDGRLRAGRPRQRASRAAERLRSPERPRTPSGCSTGSSRRSSRSTSRTEAPARLLVLAPRPRALPRQRLLPAREPRRRLPHHPDRAEDARSSSACPPVLQELHDEAARPRPRHRPDRLGQVDDARRDDRRDQPHARRSHHDHRGSDRVPPQTQALHREPARDRPRRDELRRRAPRRAPPGPRRDPPRRDARPRDDRDRAHGCRDRPPRLRHAAHPGRALHRRPAHRRLPGGPAGADPRPDRRDAAGRRHPDAPPDAPTARAAWRRSRSCSPTTPSGT